MGLRITISLILCFFLFIPNKKDPIKVGILHSSSGVMSTNETPLILSTLFAIEEINSKGGINSQLIEPIIFDGASDPETFQKGANELIDKGVNVIFGCWTSASRKSIIPILEKRNCILFYPIQFEGLEDSPNVIYLGTTPNQQLLPATKWAIDNYGKKIYVIGSDYIYPKASLKILEDFFSQNEAILIGSQLIALNDFKIEEIIRDISQKKPDIIINLLNGSVNEKFFTLLKYQKGLEHSAILSFSVTEDNIQTWNVELPNHYLCWSYFQNLKDSVNNNFLINIRKLLNSNIIINDPMEIAYAGVNLWASSVKQLQTNQTSVLLNFFKGQGFLAPEGIVTVSSNNHLFRNIILAKVYSKKKPEIIWESNQPIPPEPFLNYRDKKQWQDLLIEWYSNWGGKWGA
jgi:urea transport system substrate-binding protein